MKMESTCSEEGAITHKQSTSLDFERVINTYSIKETRGRVLRANERTVARKSARKSLLSRWLRSERNEQFLRNDSIVSESSCISLSSSVDLSSAFPSDNQLNEDKKYPNERSGLLESPSKVNGNNRQPEHGPKTLTQNNGVVIIYWLMIILIGLFTGITAVIIVDALEKVVSIRTRYLAKINFSSHVNIIMRFISVFKVFTCYAAFNLILAISSSCMSLFIAPDTVGSGIPEVAAYLNGVRVRRFSNFNNLWVKIVGTILSVSSGLAIGPEGPLVHLGAIIAVSLHKSGWVDYCFWKFYDMSTSSRSSEERRKAYLTPDPKLNSSQKNTGLKSEFSRWIYTNILRNLAQLRNDASRRDLISIGAAAGFAASFGAPIGGVLFSLEETSSYFAKELLWKTLTATAISTFCIAFYHGDIKKFSVLNLYQCSSIEQGVNDVIEQVDLFVFIGICGGLLGALFNAIVHFTQHKRKQVYAYYKDNEKLVKLSEVLFLSLFTSILCFFVPTQTSWYCRDKRDIVDGCHDSPFWDLQSEFQFNCRENQYNELGKVLLGSREEAMEAILSNPSAFKPQTLITVGVLFFILMVSTYGVSLPFGIFMPTILIGSSLGGYLGSFFDENLGRSVSPSTFALLGAAALLSGIQRNAVSLCVILMEGTGTTEIIIPVAITVVCARQVGNMLTHGLYEMGMDFKDYPYLNHVVKQELDMFKVSDIMTKDVTTLKCIESAGDIERVLHETSVHGFPVIDVNQKLVGLVRRDQLVALLECGIFIEESVHSFKKLDSQYISSDDYHPAVFDNALHIKNDRYDADILEDISDVRAILDDDLDANEWLSDNLIESGGKSMIFPDQSLLQGNISASGKNRVVTKNGVIMIVLKAEDRLQHINIRAIMNRGPYCVIEGAPVSNAYSMFTKLGLRHLCVLGSNGCSQVVGILTRSNFNKRNLERKTGFLL